LFSFGLSLERGSTSPEKRPTVDHSPVDDSGENPEMPAVDDSLDDEGNPPLTSPAAEDPESLMLISNDESLESQSQLNGFSDLSSPFDIGEVYEILKKVRLSDSER